MNQSPLLLRTPATKWGRTLPSLFQALPAITKFDCKL